MRKLPSVSLDNRRSLRGRRITLFLVLTLLLIGSPVLYESTRLVVAGWQSLFAPVPSVPTPVLDALTDGYKSANFDVQHWSRGVFNSTPWKSSYVIPFAIFWTGVLAMLLRRC